MNLIGIDFGSKRVGVATGGTETGMAFPRGVLANDEKLVSLVCNIAKEYDTKEVVLGESKNLNGEDNPIMEAIMEFKVVLENKGFTVHMVSEVFTSQEAERLQGKNGMLDASAAAIILQSYLDKLKNKN